MTLNYFVLHATINQSINQRKICRAPLYDTSRSATVSLKFVSLNWSILSHFTQISTFACSQLEANNHIIRPMTPPLPHTSQYSVGRSIKDCANRVWRHAIACDVGSTQGVNWKRSSLRSGVFRLLLRLLWVPLWMALKNCSMKNHW